MKLSTMNFSRLAPRSLLDDRRRLWEIAATLALLGFFEIIIWKRGLATALLLLFVAGAILLALAGPTAFAVTIFVLAPLPALDTFFGFSLPAGLDPFDFLVVIGAGVALQVDAPGPLRGRRLLWVALVASAALLTLAWYRTYGQATGSGVVSFIVRPFAGVVAGLLVARLVPRERLVRTIAVAMAFSLLLVYASVVLQRLGVFSFGHQAEDVSRDVATLRGARYGGLMESGNDAGALIALFAVPTYVLLRSMRMNVLGSVVLFASVPLLLLTVSRGATVAFLVSLLLLLILDRRAARGMRMAFGVLAVAAVLVTTVGQTQLRFFETTLLENDTNVALNGRQDIWKNATQFLADKPSRWVVGGGLDAFRSYAQTTSLGGSFATHNAALKLLTNGGAIMLAVWILLLLGLWSLTRRADPDLALALRIALIGVVVVGLTSDTDVLSRPAAWIWALAGAVAASRTDEAVRMSRRLRKRMRRQTHPAPVGPGQRALAR